MCDLSIVEVENYHSDSDDGEPEAKAAKLGRNGAKGRSYEPVGTFENRKNAEIYISSEELWSYKNRKELSDGSTKYFYFISLI